MCCPVCCISCPQMQAPCELSHRHLFPAFRQLHSCPQGCLTSQQGKQGYRGPPTTHHPHKRPSSSGGIFLGGVVCELSEPETKAKSTHHPQFCTRDVDRRFCGGGAWISRSEVNRTATASISHDISCVEVAMEYAVKFSVKFCSLSLSLSPSLFHQGMHLDIEQDFSRQIFRSMLHQRICTCKDKTSWGFVLQKFLPEEPPDSGFHLILSFHLLGRLGLIYLNAHKNSSIVVCFFT